MKRNGPYLVPVKKLGFLVRWEYRMGVLFLQLELSSHGMNCCVNINLLREVTEREICWVKPGGAGHRRGRILFVLLLRLN